MDDRLLSELQRQKKYLERLPNSFAFPLFNAKQALESQRRSGYRNTASAAREITDNAIEAGADKIHVVFDSSRNATGRRITTAVAFIDNGPGMLPMMARYALSWGGGTHFDDPAFIGKFGFGLPNASINQTRQTEVYTRTAPHQPFTKVWLNLNDYSDFGPQSIPEPVEADLPAFVKQYLRRTGLTLDHGTVVVWVDPDRLTYKTPAMLKEHLIDDFGVTYRYLIVNKTHPLELVVEGVRVQPVDPLFLLPEGRYHLPPDQGGAQLIEERFLSLKYVIDPESVERHLKIVENPMELDTNDPNLLAFGSVHIRIARFPFGFAEGKRASRQEITDAERRFEIRKPRRGMAFVRAGREIQTIDAFPRSVRDEANGLGQWPVLLTYAYHWGVEVNFQPELDDVFGITNDKQGVRPLEDFWRVLHEAGIDASLRRENSWQQQEAGRRKKERVVVNASNRPTPAETAAQDADVAEGGKLRVPNHLLAGAQERLEAEVLRWSRLTDRSLEEIRCALINEAKRRPYRVDYYDSEDGPFYKPDWIGSQVVIYINRSHPFYDVLYRDVLELPGGRRAKEAIDVLLITLGKTELEAEDEQMKQWYETQRKKRWSQFLETAMKSLNQRLSNPDEAEEEDNSSVE